MGFAWRCHHALDRPPASKDTATATLEKKLWAAADERRANRGLKLAQYHQPVLGLIFRRFADAKFAARRAELEKAETGRRGSRVDDAGSYHTAGVLFLPPETRFGELLEYPEGGKNDIEEEMDGGLPPQGCSPAGAAGN